MDLTSQQARFFETFGYLQFPSLFWAEIRDITEAFEEEQENKERSLGDGPTRVQFIDENNYLSALLDDHRIDGIGGTLLGQNFNYTTSEGNLYSGDTPWHSDHNVDRGYLSVKMALYLDPVNSGTGGLRVIPGSHMEGDQFAESLSGGWLGNGEDCDSGGGESALEIPAVALDTNPGDLLVFNHKIKHSSFGGGTRRRQLAINLQQRYRNEDLGLLREKIAHLANFGHRNAYGEVIVSTASSSRMSHLEQRIANEGHLRSLATAGQTRMG